MYSFIIGELEFPLMKDEVDLSFIWNKIGLFI